MIRKQVDGTNVDKTTLSLEMPLFNKDLNSPDDLDLTDRDEGKSPLTPYSWIINDGAGVTSTLTVLISDIAGNSSQYIFSATQANAPTLLSSVVI